MVSFTYNVTKIKDAARKIGDVDGACNEAFFKKNLFFVNRILPYLNLEIYLSTMYLISWDSPWFLTSWLTCVWSRWWCQPCRGEWGNVPPPPGPSCCGSCWCGRTARPSGCVLVTGPSLSTVSSKASTGSAKMININIMTYFLRNKFISLTDLKVISWRALHQTNEL